MIGLLCEALKTTRLCPQGLTRSQIEDFRSRHETKLREGWKLNPPETLRMPAPDPPPKPTPSTSCGDCKTERVRSCASLGTRGFPSQTTKPGARWHAEGQTQDHGRLPDSSRSTDLLCRSFLSLHSEAAATSVIDCTSSCLQWCKPGSWL